MMQSWGNIIPKETKIGNITRGSLRKQIKRRTWTVDRKRQSKNWRSGKVNHVNEEFIVGRARSMVSEDEALGSRKCCSAIDRSGDGAAIDPLPHSSLNLVFFWHRITFLF